MSQLRKNPLNEKWTVISPERARRRDAFLTDEKIEHKCPFCTENSGLYEIFKIDTNEGRQLTVVPNRYPILGIEGNLDKYPYGLFDNISGIGANEVIIDSNRHGLKAKDYTENELFNLFRTFKIRMDDLSKDIRFKYLSAVKSIGKNAGEIIPHPHSQLVALPVIPANIENEVKNSQKYFIEKERCIACDIIDSELHSRQRIVYENYDYIAFCQYSSEYPFSVSIYPKNHSFSYIHTIDNSLKQLSDITKEIFIRLSYLLGDVSIMMSIITSPLKDNRQDIKGLLNYLEQSFHWHLEIRPVITPMSAVEWATGITVNPVAPEDAASYLREVTAK